MSSILKVDTIQDQDGNNIINESGNVITIGASGDTITVPAGATVSGFTSAGIDDNATSTAITISSDEDVTFTEDILLGDSKKAIFGAGSDLQIYHDGSNSYIDEQGTGSLFIRGANTVDIIKPDGTEYLARFVSDSYNKLYYDGSERFETTSAGATVTGTLTTGAITSTGNLTVTGDATITKNDTPLYLNRTSSDGEVLRFSKDGTAVGLAAVKSSNLYISSNSSNNTGFKINPNAITPAASNGTDRDNAIDLGASGAAYKDLYLGGGVFLGGTGTANELSDYEEGTWSPAISGTSGGASGVTFGDRFGSYVKIGKSVTVQVYINLDSWSSGPSGNLTVATLPFTSSSTSTFRSSVTIGFTQNFSQAPAGGIIANSATVINLKKFNSTSAQDNMTNDVTASDVSGDEVIMLTATYEV